MKIHFTLATLTVILAASSVHGQFVQEKEISDTEKYLTYQEMQLVVFDDKTTAPLTADVTVIGLHPRDPIVFENIADTLFEIKNYRLYTVSCAKVGYMYYSEKFWPDEELIHQQKVGLHPLEVGLKTDIQDITFLGNKTEIYHKSKPALDDLAGWLKDNPKVKIAVIGHVNGPDASKSRKFYMDASVDRAKAVVEYLISLGISADRLVAKGAGNSEMVYPDPQTDWQNQANRRIQIEILEIKK